MKHKYLLFMTVFLGIGLIDLVYLNSKIIPALRPQQRAAADRYAKQSAEFPAGSQTASMTPETTSRDFDDRDQIIAENTAAPDNQAPPSTRNADALMPPTDQDVDRFEKEAPAPEPPASDRPKAHQWENESIPPAKKNTPRPPSLMQKIIVQFDVGEHQLSSKQYRNLISQLERIQFTKKIRIRVDGHSDQTGSGIIDNDLLSQQRADFIAELLRQKGVLEDHITAKGYGDSQPVDKNDTPEAFAKNRRAEIKIYKDES